MVKQSAVDEMPLAHAGLLGNCEGNWNRVVLLLLYFESVVMNIRDVVSEISHRLRRRFNRIGGKLQRRFTTFELFLDAVVNEEGLGSSERMFVLEIRLGLSDRIKKK